MKQKLKVVIKDLNFYYEQKQAIKEFNLEIPKKQIFAILGP
ncbi:MAG TPA: phosphate ABC transporter ATP-binding protein, partial [Clostridiales bacterium]|nr:phosphate ABC transporter ATP-binding protein [Clostridiales bacterium]